MSLLFQRLTFLLLISVFSVNLKAACQCMCSEFRSRGGERKVCPDLPEKQGPYGCTTYWFTVKGANSKSECDQQWQKYTNCTGYMIAYPSTEKWIYSADGQYHTCRFN